MVAQLGINKPSPLSQKLVVALSKISILDLAAFAKVDVFLSVFLKAIAVIKADIFVDIGKR